MNELPPGSPETSGPDQHPNKPERPRKRPEDYVSAQYLKDLVSSSGFRFQPDYRLPPHKMGYTVIEKDAAGRRTGGTIFYNPIIFDGLPEAGVQPIENPEGFFYHEAGHHAPEVRRFQDKLLRHLDKIEIPEGFKIDSERELKFLKLVDKNLHNALADIWLESYQSRPPYALIRRAIKEFNVGMGVPPDWKALSKVEQLLQSLLCSRYNHDGNFKEKLDEDVYRAYRRIQDTGALKAIMDRSSHENFFATPGDLERAIERKFHAYKSVFLPEFLKLMQADLEERKKGKLEKKKGETGETDQTKAAEEKLTPEEIKEIVDEILGKVDGEGHDEREIKDDESEAERQKIIESIKETLEALKRGEKPKPAPSGPKQRLRGDEALRELAEEMERLRKEAQDRGLAEAIGTRQESIQNWERIKEENREQISSLAAALSEIFLDDRRTKLEYLKREGLIVPGLEYETISALISGELDPDTKMHETRNPEFMETEIEFIVDVSGSMSGAKLDASVDLMVVIVEAFKKIREDLAGEDLLTAPDEQPFRVGVTTFDVKPNRVTDLDEPISDLKEIKIIDQASRIGGGTDETQALKEVYSGLQLRKGNVIKIIVVLTDGEGNRDAVTPIIQKVEEDNEVIFLAVGLGSDVQESNGVIDTYVKPLRKPENQRNVFGHTEPNPEKVQPFLIDFLKREVEKRRAQTP